MTKAANLVREVQSVGGELTPLDNGNLRIEAPNPLSEHLMARLRQEKVAVIRFLAYREYLASGWDAETAWLIEWFNRTPPPAEPFELYHAVTVLRPDRFWESLKGDIAAGPDKARAYTGAFQKDLRRLAELFSAPAKFRQLKG